MPDISGLHTPFVVVHVLGVVLFLLAHGVSAAVLLRIQSERDVHALRVMLDLSRRSVIAMSVGYLLWFATGVLAGFSGNWWTSGRYWIWVSLVLAIAITAVMTPLGRVYLNRVREQVGIDPRTGAVDPDHTVDPVALESALRSGRPALLAGLGIVGLGVLSWLMVAKPF